VQWPATSRIGGSDLDALARRYLWAAGLDFGHGTGHGVGHFLNVHEGPHGISKYRSEPLLEGMVVTDGNDILEIIIFCQFLHFYWLINLFS